jgi:glutamyl-tRNA reductase
VFIACGLNHKTAPLSVREKIALPEARQDTLLYRLTDLPAVNEAAILSTCNRTEIYCETDAPEQIIPWLAREHQLPQDTIAPYAYIHHGHDGVRHVLRVASGLDSMMVGEPQILGQMKQAWQQACRLGTAQNSLRQVFPYVFRASKRIRNQSGIGNNPVSIAYAAVQLINRLFSDLASLNILIIGSGDTSTLVAKYLQKQGAKRFMLASRKRENAHRLAEAITGESLDASDIPQRLPQADVVISATACPFPFISKNMVKQAMSLRNNAPMVFLDLAVPRDIEADAGSLNNVQLYNLDDLQIMIEKGMEERHLAAKHAEQLIDHELDNYIRWHRTLQAKDLICDYRSQMEELAQIELQRAVRKLSTGQCQFNVLAEFSERLVNKLTHRPTTGLRRAARDDHSEILDLARYLLDTPAKSAIP